MYRPQSLRFRRAAPLLLVLAWSLGSRPASAQISAPPLASYSDGPAAFPQIFRPYRPQSVTPPSFQDAVNLASSLEDGKLSLSLKQLSSAVGANNLDIASSRYNYYLADVDLLRAKSGRTPRGVTSVTRIPNGLGSLAGGTATGGGSATSARAVTVGPRGSYDPSLSLNFSVDTTATPQTSTRVSGATVVTTHTTALGARYTQAFATGTSFSVAFNIQRQSTTSRNTRFNPSLTSNYNLSVNQQLLSGFGFAANRRFLDVTKTNRDVAHEGFRQQVITTLTAAQNAYWDLVAAQELVRTSEQALQVSQTLYDNNRKQAQIGTLAPLDVVASESEVASRRRDLIVAQTSEQVAELKLKNTMSRQMDASLAAAQIAASDSLPQPQDADIPGFDDALATAMRNRPELRQAQDGIQNQQVAVDYTGKKLKPTLSLFGMLTSAGRQADLFGAWQEVGALNFPEYAYGFSFSFTIGNRAAQADNLRARMEMQQSETSLERTRNQIRLEVRNAIIRLQQAKAQVAAASRAVAANQQSLDAEQKKLQAGTSTPYNVIRVERDLYSAQLSEVQARVSYAKALVEMDRATGVTVEKAGLHLDELLAANAGSSQESAGTPMVN